MPDIHRFRMLDVGSQLPFHDGYDISREGARKWVQHGHASRDAATLSTIFGECRPLPPDEWERFAEGITISGILELEGNPVLTHQRALSRSLLPPPRELDFSGNGTDQPK